MKKKLSILIFSLLSIYCSAQTSAYFNDTLYPFGAGAYNFDGVCQDDSFYYVLGGVNNFESNWQLMILKLNRNGVVTNKKKYTDSSLYHASYPFNSIENQQKTLTVITSIVDSLNRVHGKVYSINKYTLDTCWTKAYPHPDTTTIASPSDYYSVFTAIKATSDGGYILGGNHMSSGNVRSYLRKVDSVGNTQWVKAYNNVIYLYDIDLHDSGYVFLHKFGYKVNKISFTDSLGNIIHERLINNGYTGTTVSSLAKSGQSEYVGLNTYEFSTIPEDRYGVLVYKYDYNTNQVLWEKTFRTYYSIEFLTLHPALGIEVLPDSSVIVSGTLIQSGAKRKGFILKLSSNGDSLWTRTYDLYPQHNNSFQINDLLPTQDGGFIGVGFIWDQNGDYAAWMFKVDANGLYTNIIAPTSYVNLQAIKCYPNPASDKTKLVFFESLENSSQLQFYNMLGQKVMECQIDKGILVKEIDLSDLNNGQYLYLLSDKHGVIGTGKLIVDK